MNLSIALKNRSIAKTALLAICLCFMQNLFAASPPAYVGIWEKAYPSGAIAELLVLRADGTAEVVEYHPDGKPQSVKRLASWSVKEELFHVRFSYIALRSVGGGWIEIPEERLRGKEMFIGPTSVPVRLQGNKLDIGNGVSVFSRKGTLSELTEKRAPKR
jgi:hypothetical protein